MTEQAARGSRARCSSSTRRAPCRRGRDEIVSVVDIETLEDRPSPGRLELNDLGVVRLRLAEPLAVDPYRREPRDRRVHPDRRVDERHGRRRHGRRGDAVTRRADPYRDLAVIDSRAPRTNQAVVGIVSVLAVATGWWWLLALLALQLAVGLDFGRRFCLPCLLYFELIQPRFGEGPLEDSRPPRAANIVGLVVLSRGSVAYAAGLTVSASGSALLVAALALLAASPASAPAARRTSSAACCAAGRSSPARCRSTRAVGDLAVRPRGRRRRAARRDDRHGRRQPDDADADPALRLQPEDGGRHRHPPRRGLQVVRRGPPPAARQRARGLRSGCSWARRRCRSSASRSRARSPTRPTRRWARSSAAR